MESSAASNNPLATCQQHLLTEIKKPHPSQIETGHTTMSFDSHINENFTIQFSISFPLEDPLGKLNKFSCLFDAKHLLAQSTPSAVEPLQHGVVDDCMEVIQDHIVCPLLEQQFMSTMGPSNRARHIQAFVESPFTLLAKALSLLLPVCLKKFKASVLNHPQFHQTFVPATLGFTPMSDMTCTKIQLATLDPLVMMELELVFTHWHFGPTWNGHHLDDIIPNNDHFAFCPEPTSAVTTTLTPIDIPTLTVEPPIPSHLNEGRATR